MVQFKMALHQSIQSLFGAIYSGLHIDILHFVPMSAKQGDVREEGIHQYELLLRVGSEDQSMVLQSLACLTGIQGQRCRPRIVSCSPQLYLANLTCS